ncbi:hypothetical protein [Caenimonas sp. SL110]|uniref:hypothetical protein n=1 Tax=Caenimonas sp. SL110 TaxID=1450524 RepID=UPI000653BAEF|nr:hypothetical protein [Caenimonas sp. SL110]
MTGLFLLLLATLWFAITIAAAVALTSRLKHRPSRVALAMAVFGLLLPLPLLDELTAKPFFDTLCEEQAVLVLDSPKTDRQRVWFDSGVRTNTSIGLLDSVVYRKQYVEIETGRLVYHYATVTATGGWLVRLLQLSESNSPLTFGSTCAPPELSNLNVWLAKHGITELPRPISN